MQRRVALRVRQDSRLNLRGPAYRPCRDRTPTLVPLNINAMKALLCTHYGTPDDLELAEIAEPKPGSGEVLVKIHAAALNFFDTLIIAGKYQFKPAPPFSPAAEFAGTVEALGPGVTSVKLGDRVLGFMTYGATREFVAVDAGKLIKLPDALEARARLKAGESLAVLGASGGVGLAAV